MMKECGDRQSILNRAMYCYEGMKAPKVAYQLFA
jgi:hypothetical protein